MHVLSIYLHIDSSLIAVQFFFTLFYHSYVTWYEKPVLILGWSFVTPTTDQPTKYK